MTPTVLQFLAAGGVIVLAGAALTQFGDIIAERTRLGGLLVGSILIAGATSLPELAIDIHALRLDSADMAAGDLMGSSLFNLLILAVLDLTRYSHGQMFSRASAEHAVAASVSIILTAIVAIFILLGPELEGVTVLRVGPGTIVLVAAYAFGARLVFSGTRDRATADREGGGTPLIPAIDRLGLKGAVAGYLVAAAVILVAAPFLARAAKELAEQTGLGGTFFGTTFVALCTSLPEVTTTFSAVRMKAFDMAIGNIFGSNSFNMLIFVPLDAVFDGSLFSAVATTHAYTAMCVIVVTTVVVLGQLRSVERKRPFLEPDALLAVALILAALTGLYFVRQ